MAKKTTKTLVTLKTKGDKPKKQEFELSHANRILSLPNSQWELSDTGFQWNGTEISVKDKK